MLLSIIHYVTVLLVFCIIFDKKVTTLEFCSKSDVDGETSCSDLRIAKDLLSTIRLNDGVLMPLFGLGVWQAERGRQTIDAVSFALRNGYRLIDTAQVYGLVRNEAEVGEGFRESGVDRTEVFIVSKVLNEVHGYQSTINAVNETLRRMKLDYVDMFLIHSPYLGHNIETFEALLDLKKLGLIRSAGVSNFGIAHLEGLKKAGLPAPSVNQIELHPYCRLEELVRYCNDNDIAPMGYSPIIRGHGVNDPLFIDMAKSYGKTPAQLLIRWSIQMGHITIPKSVRRERILENADVFGFSISKEDMQILNSLQDAKLNFGLWEG